MAAEEMSAAAIETAREATVMVAEAVATGAAAPAAPAEMTGGRRRWRWRGG